MSLTIAPAIARTLPIANAVPPDPELQAPDASRFLDDPTRPSTRDPFIERYPRPIARPVPMPMPMPMPFPIIQHPFGCPMPLPMPVPMPMPYPIDLRPLVRPMPAIIPPTATPNVEPPLDDLVWREGDTPPTIDDLVGHDGDVPMKPIPVGHNRP